MNEISDDALKKRFHELASRSFDKAMYVQTDFLTIAQQDTFLSCANNLPKAPYRFDGGHPACERRVVIFGSPEICGYEYTPDIVCVSVSPKSSRFSEDLNHRDYLGSVMGLGIKREKIGDIFVDGDTAYVFCTETIAMYLRDNLEQVRRTPVKCEILPQIPESFVVRTQEKTINVPSERTDAVVCAVFNLSRNECLRLFKSGNVCVDARIVYNAGKTLCAGNKVSVRGYGKFIYRGQIRTTKKDRMFVSVEKLI